jgi:hypothetical protein
MRGLLFLMFSIIWIGASGQWSIKTDASSFALDELGNSYLVSANRVEMYDPQGELLFVYNPSFTNRIDDIDVTRALRPMIFFKDQGFLQYLDNTLSEQNALVDLYALPFGRVELIGASADNHIWVFDSVNLELLRLDKSLSIVSRSGNLGSWFSGEMDFFELREYQDRVFLAGNSGVFVFDLFGNFDHRVSSDPVDQIFFERGLVFFEQAKGWQTANSKGSMVESVSLPQHKRQIVVRGRNSFVLDSGLFTKSRLKKD